MANWQTNIDWIGYRDEEHRQRMERGSDLLLLAIARELEAMRHG